MDLDQSTYFEPADNMYNDDYDDRQVEEEEKFYYNT
jgi:hypothetical protein